MWSQVILLIIAAFLPGDLLVLKNGKKLTCESYTVDNGRVNIQANGQTFSLPEGAVDWDASKAAQKAIDAGKAAAAEKVALEKAEKERKAKEAQEARKLAKALPVPKKKKAITFTNEDIRNRGVNGSNRTVTIRFRMVSNSIIVAMHINNKGPYNFILDTGASVTLIDPEILTRAGISYRGPTISVVGVGGRPVRAPICSLDKISMSGATVRGMDAVALQIPQLRETGVYGLIGQDFLNHFVMHLDAANKTLKLTPQRGAQKDMASKNARARNYDPNYAKSVLYRALTTMESEFRQLGQQRSTTLVNRSVANLKKVHTQIQEVRKQLRYQRSLLENARDEELSSERRDLLSSFLSCYPRINIYVDNLVKLNRTLTHAVQRELSPSMLDELTRNAQRARKSDTELAQCLQKVGR